jgi:JAB domain-containing protein similar to deubiquitination enzymes
MQLAGAWFLARIGRAVAATAGLTVLLALQPEPIRLVEAARAGAVPRGAATRVLVLSDQARRYLALQYRSYPTEFMGCMIGEVRGQTVLVHRVAPADVDSSQSTRTHVVPKQSCEGAGWVGTVGVIHSHPNGERCWYYFPGTQVASSDGQSFLRQPYLVDAIMCGSRVVWIGRDLQQWSIPLDPGAEVAAPREHQRGNRVHAGAASPTGED